jgi:16S rRNA (uracil1498-N3)-methyltransferase
VREPERRLDDPVFLADDLPDPLPGIGAEVTLAGPEGRHAAAVRRIRPGESLLLTDGRGHGVRGPAVAVGRDTVRLEVTEQLSQPEPPLRFAVVQALAKGDRSELAVELLTEIGVREIWPWQASRSVSRWTGDKIEKGRQKWQARAREATKQSRRLWVPDVGPALDSDGLLDQIGSADLALALHERAGRPLRAIRLPERGTVLIVVGPEGGIADDELADLVAAGAHEVLISDGVLRTSTAGVVACAGLMLR